MAKYKLKVLFDPGSGVCLWSENDQAKERFGYAINHSDLPLTENTKRWLDYLIAWFDTSIDWDNPTELSETWTKDENRSFQLAVSKGIQLLQQELEEANFQISSKVEF